MVSNAQTTYTLNTVLSNEYALVSKPVDINQDGAIDIVAVYGYYIYSGITWYENDGNGNFTKRMLPDETYNVSLTRAGDIDQDGDQDIITGTYNGVFLLKACIDNSAPTLTCANPTIEMDANGQYTFNQADLIQSSTNDCGQATFVSASPSMVDCADATYTLPVMVTVQDDVGNTATCIANVTVEEGTSLPDG